MHPITIYLSPTSTAVMNVTQFEPPSNDPVRRPFALLSPQAEVVIAPKARKPITPESEGAFDLIGARNSVASTTKSKKSGRKALEVTLVLRTLCLPHPIFEGEAPDNLCVYIDPHIQNSPIFSGGLTKISILPSPSKSSFAQEKEKEKEKEAATNEAEFSVAKTVIAKVQVWKGTPQDHIGISHILASTLGIRGLGDLAR